MAENFQPKPKTPKASKGKSTPKTVGLGKTKGGGSKADSLRALREKKTETSPAPVVNATGAVLLGALKTAPQFLEAGKVIWGRTVSAIFEMSELLDLAHDKLTKAEYVGLLGDLHISESSASQMRKISASQRMRKLLDTGTVFPASAHTLYLLASMEDDEFSDFTKKHDIDPDVKVEDVRTFLKERKGPRQIAAPRNTAEATTEAAKQTAQTMTAPAGGGENGPLIEDATYTTVDTTNGESKTNQPEDGNSPGAAPETEAEAVNEGDPPVTIVGRLSVISALTDKLDLDACKSLPADELTAVERAIDEIAQKLDTFRRGVSELIFNAA